MVNEQNSCCLKLKKSMGSITAAGDCFNGALAVALVRVSLWRNNFFCK
ncbi:MAG: hypothetical protein ACLTCI_10835 [[Clostridium] nexile]